MFTPNFRTVKLSPFRTLLWRPDRPGDPFPAFNGIYDTRADRRSFIIRTSRNRWLSTTLASSKRVPTTADHCVSLIRACYRQEAGLDRTLDPAALPTSGIKLKKKKASQKVLDFGAFPEWRAAWDKIKYPVHKGYHLTALLTGIRPGELANLRAWRYRRGKPHANRSQIPLNINLPMTPQIAQAIAIAMNAPPQTIVMKGLRGMKRGAGRVVERKRLHGESSRAILFSPAHIKLAIVPVCRSRQRAAAYVPHHRFRLRDFGDADPFSLRSRTRWRFGGIHE